MVTTIFDLIDDGDLDGVRELLARDPSAAAARDGQGLSALMRASYGGGGEIFEAVRAAGPTLDPWDRILTGESDGLPAPGERSPDGFTPLHIAAFAHNAAAVRTLLAADADPNELATASFAQVTPLGTAATFGANEIAELLLDRDADPERTSDHGHTPLHAAAANGNRALVELLLARGANARAKTADGQTPADLAANDEIRALLNRD
jgi:ankyrin repeat protein